MAVRPIHRRDRLPAPPTPMNALAMDTKRRGQPSGDHRRLAAASYYCCYYCDGCCVIVIRWVVESLATCAFDLLKINLQKPEKGVEKRLNSEKKPLRHKGFLYPIHPLTYLLYKMVVLTLMIVTNIFANSDPQCSCGCTERRVDSVWVNSESRDAFFDAGSLRNFPGSCEGSRAPAASISQVLVGGRRLSVLYETDQAA